MARSRRDRLLGVLLLGIGTAAGLLIIVLLARPTTFAALYPAPLIGLALMTMLIAYGYANSLLD